MDNQPGELELIPYSSIQTRRTIGEGSFGKVLLAHHKDWGDVALKKLKTNFVDERIRRKLLKEAKKLDKLSHPNIVLMLGVIMGDTCSAIVLEYMLHGALDSFLEMYETSWAMKLDFINGIVLAMNYLHTLSSPIIHRDLKPPNVLVGRDLNVKVTDFGLAMWRAYSDTSSHRLGTVTHVPPEAWGNLGLAPAPSYDVYSFAVLVWEVCTEQMPFEGVPHSLIKEGVQEGQRPDLGRLPAGTPPVLHAVIQDCWNQQPEYRPAFHIIKDALDRDRTRQGIDMERERINLMEKIVRSKGDSLQVDGDSQEDASIQDVTNNVGAIELSDRTIPRPNNSPGQPVEHEVQPQYPTSTPPFARRNNHPVSAHPTPSPHHQPRHVLDRPYAMDVQPVHPASATRVGNHVGPGVAAAASQPATDAVWGGQESLHLNSWVEPETDGEIPENQIPNQGDMAPGQEGVVPGHGDVAPGHVGVALGQVGVARAEIGTARAQASEALGNCFGTTRPTTQSQTLPNRPITKCVDTRPRTAQAVGNASRHSAPCVSSHGATRRTQLPHDTETDAQPESLQSPTSPLESMPTTAESFPRTGNGTAPGNPHVNAAHPGQQGAAHNPNLPGFMKDFMPKFNVEMPDFSKCNNYVVHQSDELGTTVICNSENSKSKNNIQIGKNNVMHVYTAPRTGTGTHAPRPAAPVAAPLPRDGITRSTRPLNSENMELVGKHLGRYWKALGRRLGFSSGELDQINADYHTDGLEEKIHQMLEKWKVKEGRGATIGVLATKLWSIERYGLAAMLK